MNLNKDEVFLFYTIWLNLLWGVNLKHQVAPDYKRPKTGQPQTANALETLKIRDAMWDNPSWIDEYLNDPKNSGIPEEHQKVILDWRNHFIPGNFLVYKHLAKYSVFMKTEEGKTSLYGVHGINDSIQETYPFPPPYFFNTVILPFKDKIIFDGFAKTLPSVLLGRNILSSFKEQYTQAKSSTGIILKLTGGVPLLGKPKDNSTKGKSQKVPSPKPKSINLPPGTTVPGPMIARYNEISQMIVECCDDLLDEEYKDISLRALAKLCRKRPSPLQRGQANSWAAGILHGIGQINFLYDKTQPLHLQSWQIPDWFDLSKDNVTKKAQVVRKTLGLTYYNFEFSLQRLIKSNPLACLAFMFS
jgi:hypothetical protein